MSARKSSKREPEVASSKTAKWRKFRVSKADFPTIQVDGNRATKRKGHNIPGHIAAKAHIARKTGLSFDSAVRESNRFCWVFKFPVGEVPSRLGGI